MAKEATKNNTQKKETKVEKKTTSTKTKTEPKKTETAKKETIKQSENSYGRTLLAAILIVVIFIGGYIGVTINKERNKHTPTEEEIRFKEEYESLNGTARSNGITNKTVSIPDQNNIKYISAKEAATMLEEGTGIIYFGYAACPKSRSAVSILLEAMKSSELDTIYYVNVRPDDKVENDIRDIYTLNDRNKPKKTKDAKEEYYYMLTLLSDYLKDYKLPSAGGKEVNTGERRINTPTVVAVVNGEVVGFHEGTVKDHELDDNEELRDLTKDEEKELLNKYTKLISKYLSLN